MNIRSKEAQIMACGIDVDAYKAQPLDNMRAERAGAGDGCGNRNERVGSRLSKGLERDGSWRWVAGEVTRGELHLILRRVLHQRVKRL